MIENIQARRSTHPFHNRPLYAAGGFFCSAQGCQSAMPGQATIAVNPPPSAFILQAIAMVTATQTVPDDWTTRILDRHLYVLCPQHEGRACYGPSSWFICSVCGVTMPGFITLGLESRGTTFDVRAFQQVLRGWGSAIAVDQKTRETLCTMLLCPQHVGELKAHQEALGTA